MIDPCLFMWIKVLPGRQTARKTDLINAFYLCWKVLKTIRIDMYSDPISNLDDCDNLIPTLERDFNALQQSHTKDNCSNLNELCLIWRGYFFSILVSLNKKLTLCLSNFSIICVPLNPCEAFAQLQFLSSFSIIFINLQLNADF